MIEFAEVLRELRRELNTAIEAGKDEPLQLELGPIELEVALGIERTGGAGAKVRFWVVELGADGKQAQTSTQRITLTLNPRIAGSSATPWVSGHQSDRER